MSADEYEYERMRAELLGLPPPERKPDPPAQATAEEANPALDENVPDDSATPEEPLPSNQNGNNFSSRIFIPGSAFPYPSAICNTSTAKPSWLMLQGPISQSPRLWPVQLQKSLLALLQEPQRVLDVEDEQMKNITGGLDELNSILTVTQKKLNKFKVVCGSLTNLLKIRIGKEDGSSSTCSTDCSRSLGSGAEAERKQDEQQDAEAEKEQSPVVNSPEKEEKSVTSQRALNLADKITSQTDRLDAMIMKAEQAEVSMSHQNKQMRSFLR